MVLALFSLLWLFAEAPKKFEHVPVDGLIEQVSAIKQSLTTEQIDHIVDANKMVDYPEMPDSSPSDKHEKAKREIIMFTRPNCPPCDQWKRCEQAKFQADGWSVAYCDQHNFGLTPHFSIEKNGKTFDHKGYLPFGKIDEVTR